MNKKKIYINAMKNIKFKNNLKEKIMLEIYNETYKKTITFFPKTLISLFVFQTLICIFTPNSVGCVFF